MYAVNSRVLMTRPVLSMGSDSENLTFKTITHIGQLFFLNEERTKYSPTFRVVIETVSMFFTFRHEPRTMRMNDTVQVLLYIQ